MGAQDGGGSPFFDRELEREGLLEYLEQEPDGVLLVLGPRNSGKTRLLEEVLYADERRRLPPLHIDARTQPITSSDDLIAGLHDAAANWLTNEPVASRLGVMADKLKKEVMESLAIFKVTATFPMVRMEVDANSPVKSMAPRGNQARIKPVLKVYKSMVEAARTSSLQEYPVIWIDEVSGQGDSCCDKRL